MVFNTQQLDAIRQAKEAGQSTTQIAQDHNAHRSTIDRFLKKETYPKYWMNLADIKLPQPTNHSGDMDAIINAAEVLGDTDLAKLAKSVRTFQKTNTSLRKQLRTHFDNGDSSVSVLRGIEMATESINQRDPVKMVYRKKTAAQPATLEILFSDLQIGKVSRFYNTEIAKKATEDYGQQILEQINLRNKQYRVERIVFAMIGDVVEDHLKHGVGSAVSTDTGLAEQMHDAIECVWSGILQPLCSLEIPMDVICVTGNHGSSVHKGMDSFKAGKYSYDYVIHNTLRRYTELSHYKHVSFNIPEGTFGHMTIYGKVAIYEHGYHNNFSEKGMTDQMRKRGCQLKIHPSYWRQGDKHHHTTFGQGDQILNGAFFGIDREGLEYSGILGFDSTPSQTIVFHVDEKRLGRSNIKDVVNIQLSQCEQEGY